MRDEIVQRFSDNLARVENLIKLYSDLGGGGQGRRPIHSSDILRAATVFLHSTLEDFLRSVLAWKWPHAPEAVLNRVPLVGTSSIGRPEKFFLAKLVAHRDKSVADLLNESVEAYLGNFSVNNVADICQILDSLELQAADFNEHFAQLEEMMQRRHHIVHQADRNPQQGRGHQRALSIAVGQVNGWRDSVERLVDQTGSRLQ